MNELSPCPDPATPTAVRDLNPWFVLKVHGSGFVGGILGRHSFMFVADLDRAHRWESVETIEAWLRELPAGHAQRFTDRQLFVVMARMKAERIVAAWNLVVPIAEPEPARSPPA